MSASEQKKQRLWIVSELYYPEETSTGYYLTRIAEGLAGEFDVSVICGQPNYSRRGTRAPHTERHRDVDIVRAFGTVLDKNVIPYRIVNMLTLSAAIFFNALGRIRRGDRVLVVTTPPLLPFVAGLAARAKGADYVLLIHDNYPEILVAAGKASGNSLVYRFLSQMNRWLYRHAAKIVVVGRDMRELLQKKCTGLEVPVTVIPNWAELESVEPSPRSENPLLNELGISGKLVFLYAGNMGYPNDVESIVRCAEMLKEDDRFHFVFLGAGAKRKWLESEIARAALRNVSLLDPRPRSEQKVFLNACDVAFVSLVSRMRGVSMPSRTYNILAVGKPILAIAEPGSEVDLVLRDDNVGWLAPPGNALALRDTVEAIWNARSGLEDMGRRARAAALTRYSLEGAVARYQAELRR